MRYPLFILFTILLCSSHAQRFNPPVRTYSPTESGNFNAGQAACIVQDDRGIIYFASADGVVEFDGNEWKFIEANEDLNRVFSLDINSDGEIFLGGSGYIGMLKSDRFGNYKFKELNSLLDVSPENLYVIWNTICIGDKTYFLGDHHLLIYHDDKIETIETENSYHTMYECNGELYVRERKVGLTKLTAGELKPVKDGETFKDFGLFGMIETKKGNILVTYELGMFIQTKNGIAPILSPDSVELKTSKVLGATKLDEDLIALETSLNGILVIDLESRIVRRLDYGNGLSIDRVNQVFVDNRNNFWAATAYGLMVIDFHSHLNSYASESYLEGQKKQTIEFDDRIFVCTTTGLYVSADSSRRRQKFLRVDSQTGSIERMSVVKNNLFFTTRAGLYKISGSYPNYREQLVSHEISGYKMLEIFNKFLLVEPSEFNDHSLLKFDPRTGIQSVVFDKQARILRSRPLENPSNQAEIWGLQNWSSPELFCLKFSENELNVFTGVVDETSNAFDQYHFPFFYQDQVLVSSQEGISQAQIIGADSIKLQVIDHPLTRFGQISETEIVGDSLFFVAEGRLGCLYKEVVTYPVIHKNIGGINDLMFAESKNVLYISTDESMVIMNLAQKERAVTTAECLIRRIYTSSHDTLFNGGQNNVNLTDSIYVLDYNTNSINFSVAFPNFDPGSYNEYSARLVGLDTSWSDWTRSNEFHYTKLPEGIYRFEIKARGSNGAIGLVSSVQIEILPPWYRSATAYVIYFLIGFMAIAIVLYILRTNKIIKRQKKEVEAQKHEIEHSHAELEEKNEEIMDSINYAKRIQTAILPPDKLIKEYLANSFVLYVPKDIVAGDFYWMEAKDGHVIFAAADCTGHGVPGAMVSVICNSGLNRSVREFGLTDPGLILDKTREIVIQEFEKSEEEVKDGMDIAICSIKGDKLEYAGANNPLWIVRKGSDEIEQIKADKQPIGQYMDMKPFTTHSTTLQAGDTFYIFSDGFADQFGGEKGKKFKSANFKRLLLSIQDKELDSQREIIYDSFEKWRGNLEQIDDVCVLAYRH